MHSFSAVICHSAGDLCHLAARSCFFLSLGPKSLNKEGIILGSGYTRPISSKSIQQGSSALTAVSWFSVSETLFYSYLRLRGCSERGERGILHKRRVCPIDEECQKGFSSLLIKWCFLICTEQNFSVGLNRYNLVCCIGMNKQDI